MDDTNTRQGPAASSSRAGRAGRSYTFFVLLDHQAGLNSSAYESHLDHTVHFCPSYYMAE